MSKSNLEATHKNLDKHRHIKLTIDNPNIDNIGEIIYSHIKKDDTMNEYYLVRCESKIFPGKFM